MQNQFYKDLLRQYINIQFPPMYEKISKIGGPVSWYLADSNHNLISVEKGKHHVIEIDTKSAFPTICRNLYGNNSKFIQQMDSIEEKRGKNIFIATSLKGEPLKTLNNICKIVILGIIFDIGPDEDINEIDILELKKDGCLIICNNDTFQRLNNLNNLNNNYTKYLLERGFAFHLTEYLKYLRCNQTSFIISQDENLTIKGNYKKCPSELHKIINDILLNKNYDENEILKIYSKKYFYILQKFSLMQVLKEYYIVEGEIINSEGKYKKYNTNLEIDPRLYLKLFVFPTILSQIKKI